MCLPSMWGNKGVAEDAACCAHLRLHGGTGQAPCQILFQLTLKLSLGFLGWGCKEGSAAEAKLVGRGRGHA